MGTLVGVLPCLLHLTQEPPGPLLLMEPTPLSEGSLPKVDGEEGFPYTHLETVGRSTVTTGSTRSVCTGGGTYTSSGRCTLTDWSFVSHYDVLKSPILVSLSVRSRTHTLCGVGPESPSRSEVLLVVQSLLGFRSPPSARYLPPRVDRSRLTFLKRLFLSGVLNHLCRCSDSVPVPYVPVNSGLTCRWVQLGI